MPAPSSKQVDRFSALFRGRSDAYGQYTVEEDGFTKVEGGTFTKEEPTPKDAWVRHLSGQNPGLGIIPLTETGNCYWGAIDYDDPDDPVRIDAKVQEMGFPLVVCQSKSGGVHLYCFLIDPVSAELMMAKLMAWAQSLGIGKNTSGAKGGGRAYTVETFPKQASASIGNWINLPYFGTGKSNRRWGVVEGQRSGLNAWLTYAESNRVSAMKFKGWHTADPSAIFADGPPCLATLHADGLGAGMRNTVLFNIGIFFRQQSPDEWVDRLSQYNDLHVDPPLPSNEIDRIVGQISEGTYWYQCDVPPLCDLCEKKECKDRKFGVDSFKDSTKLPKDMPEMSGLTYLESEPARWFLKINTREITLTTESLLSSMRFRSAVVEQLGIYLPPIKQPAWDKFLKGAMAEKKTITPPREMGIFGRFLTLFGQFVEQRLGATSDSDLRRGKPVEKMGEPFEQPQRPYVVFTLEGLRVFLDRHRFYDYKDTDLYPRLRMLESRSRRMRIDGHAMRVWWVPLDAITDFTDDADIEVTPGDKDEPAF